MVVNYLLTLPGSSILCWDYRLQPWWNIPYGCKSSFTSNIPGLRRKGSRYVKLDGFQKALKEGSTEHIAIPGDFVAFVASNSTEKCPKVFFKIIRRPQKNLSSWVFGYWTTVSVKIVKTFLLTSPWKGCWLLKLYHSIHSIWKGIFWTREWAKLASSISRDQSAMTKRFSVRLHASLWYCTLVSQKGGVH